MATIDMQTMRYINLLDRITRVKTVKCFAYNNTVIFAVSENMMSQAIGPGAVNLRRLQEQIGKRIKVVREVNGIGGAKDFVEAIVSPVGFKSIDINEGLLTITAGSQHKAALIGRNRRRYEELSKIIKDAFNLELKII